jgi:hypothetical protein
VPVDVILVCESIESFLTDELSLLMADVAYCGAAKPERRFGLNAVYYYGAKMS